ncbi:FKBP-type peptidyl-prolyl cis-trans isomerase [Leucobacter sp. BZR 635]
MKLSRVLLPSAIVGALLLTGCTTGGGTTQDASGADCLASGAASDAIAVKGDVGVDLELTNKLPLKADKLERTVLTEGKGKVIEDGQTVDVALSLFNGKSGEPLQQQPTAPMAYAKGTMLDWANEAFRCAVPGQQVALTASFNEMYDGVEPEQMSVADMTKEDAVVVVMEFGEISKTQAEPGTLEPGDLLKKAEGKEQAAPKDFPAVKLDADGKPEITMPEGVEAPTELSVATLIEGDGAVVEPGDRVYVHYRGVIWRTGEEFDSSWKRGAPVPFRTNEVIPGFTKALEGQKVGSQVISVVPAEDGGYGALKLEEMGHKPDDVMVFVLDILGAVSPE